MIRNYTFTLFILVIASQLFGQSHINRIDTNLAATTNIYLSRQGKATVALDTSSYNQSTDLVYISQTEFNCSSLLVSNVLVQVIDTSVFPIVFRFSGTTNMLVKDTSAPVVTLKSLHNLYLGSNGKDTLHFADVDNGSWDSCGISLNGFQVLNQTIYDCSDLGTISKTIIVADDNGNQTSQTIGLNVADTLRPVLSLAADTFYLNPNTLTKSISFVDLDDGSFDNCGIDSTSLNGTANLNLDCSYVGSNYIVVRAYDGSGNLALDSVAIFVADTSSPTYTLNPLTAYLSGSTVAINRSAYLSNVSGGCSSVVFTALSDTVFNCTDVALNPHYMKFSLAVNGHLVTDSAMVTVLDTASPSLALHSDTLILINNAAPLVFADVDAGSTDNCQLDSALLNGANQINYSCLDTGWQNVVVQLFDSSGNMSVDSVSVFIADTVSPSYVVKDFTAYFIQDSVVVSRSDILDSVSGGCYPPTIQLLSDTIFNCGDIATNPHYIKFSSTSGTTTMIDSAMVTILDTVAPTLVLQTDTLPLVNGAATLVFSSVDAGSFDNCSLDSALLNGMNQVWYTCADTGSNWLNVQLFDAFGNASSDSIQVVVLDTILPAYTTVADTAYLVSDSVVFSRSDLFSTIQGTGCFAPTITFLSDTVFTCAAVQSNPNFIAFNFTAGSYSVTDSIPVIAVDTVKPTLVLQTDTLIIVNGVATLAFSQVDGGSVDNCALDSAQLNGLGQLQFTCADLGPHNVGVTLFDIHGNSESDSIVIVVADTVSSGYTKTPHTAYLIGDSVTVNAADILTDVKGGCIPPVVQITSDTVFTCADVALNPHYITFNFNVGGNSMADSVMVTVLDTVAPTLLVRNDTIPIQNGMATLSFSDIDNGSSDNCGLDSAQLNGSSTLQFTCAELGLNSIQVTLFDVNGNQSMDSVLVFVADSGTAGYSVAPVIAYLQSDSTVISTADFVTSMSGTGCNPAFIAITGDSVFTCADVSSNPNYIYFTFTGGGQTVNDSVAITVLDTAKPNLVLQTDTIPILNGFATLNFNNIDAGSSDNCSLDSALLNGASQLLFSCLEIGQHNVGVQLFDVHGNSTSDSISIYVVDTVQPSYTVTPVTVYLNAQSMAVARSEYLSNVVGGCAAPTITVLSDTVFDCAAINTNPHYIKFSMTGGIVNVVDSAAITLVDTIAPSLALKSDTVFLNAAQVPVSFLNVDNGSADNCQIDSALVNGASTVYFGCADGGKNTIYVQLFDASGNVSSDSVDVYLQDTVTPTYNKAMYVAYLSGTSSTVSRADVISNLSGGCSVPFFEFTTDSVFDCMDVSTNPNYLHFTVSNGLQPIVDSVQITVLDTTAPVVSIKPPPALALGVDGTRTLTWNDVLASYPSDNCGVDSIQIVPPILSCNNTGGYIPVLISVFDESGNFTNRSSFVLAMDISPPVVVAKQDTVRLDSITGQVNITVGDVTDTVFDACGLGTVSLSQSAFSCQDTGLVSVNVVATDLHNNTTTIPVSVYVQDLSAPVFNVLGTVPVFLDGSGQAPIGYSDFNIPLAFDNCQITDTALSQQLFTCIDLGADSVQITLTDYSGNATSQYGKVIVVDTIKPVIVTQNITRAIDTTTGLVILSANDVLISLTDNCGIDPSTILLSQTLFTCNDLGTNTIFISASDLSGNSIYTTAEVTITASSLSAGQIFGDTSLVCGNSYYNQYLVVNGNLGSTFEWKIEGGQILNSLNKGSEIYVYWNPDTMSSSYIYFKEINPNLCVDAYSDTLNISKIGLAPDTSAVVWWSAQAKTTLVCTDQMVNYFRWGYSSFNGSAWSSIYLPNEDKNSYHNPDLGYNVDVLGYRYWCETSNDGKCWTRNFHNRMNPIGLNDYGMPHVSIQPNPFRARLSIQADKQITKIKIFDLTGKVVFARDFGGETPVDLNALTHLPPSTYMMRIEYKNGQMSNHKIIRVQ